MYENEKSKESRLHSALTHAMQTVTKVRTSSSRDCTASFKDSTILPSEKGSLPQTDFASVINYLYYV